MTQAHYRQQMTDLCRRIPTVADCDGVEPWDQEKFAAAQAGRSRSERMAASFVVLVWTQDTCHPSWSDLPEFDLTYAAASCDSAVREVIAEWLLNPFFP